MIHTSSIKNKKEISDKLLSGVDQLADSVASTLGPGGRTVLIMSQEEGMLHNTKDGVTVAKAVYLEDPFENMGAQMVKSVAEKTVRDAGDGPQPLYSKVLTPTGFVSMGDIMVGDDICGTNGTTQKVLGVYPKGLKEVFKVKFFDNREVECCEDHLWSIIKAHGSKRVETVRSIIDSKKIIVEKNGHKRYGYYVPSTIVEFKEENKLPIDPYLLGLLIGDGSLSGNGSVELSLGFNKKHILDKIKTPKGVSFSCKLVESKNCYRVKFKGSKGYGKGTIIKNILDSLGLLGVKSDTKFIPKEYLYSSIQSRNRLLQGLLDTDGHINSRDLFEYSTVSKALSLDITNLCRGLGRHIGGYLMDRKEDSSYSNKPIYRLTERLGFKQGIKIVGIERTGIETEMQCLKVSNQDSLYITNDYIVTHNTTTASVLARAIYAAGLKAIEKGANAVQLKKGIDAAVKEVVSLISLNKKEIKDTHKDVYNIAKVSSNNDTEIADLIAKAMESVSYKGSIEIKPTDNPTSTMEMEKGMTFDRGYISRSFITNREKSSVEFKNAWIVVCDFDISQVSEILKPLELAAEKGIPLVLIAGDVNGEALATILHNLRQEGSTIQFAAVSAPGWGSNTQEYLKDIAASVGAKALIESEGLTFEDFDKSWIGACESITITDSKTMIVNGNVNEEELVDRISIIKNRLKENISEPEKNSLELRKSRLTTGVASIKIGGASQIEVGEKKDRADDALFATRCALEEGIVPGGGRMLHWIADKLCELEDVGSGDDSFVTGFNLLRKALREPYNVILKNSGVESRQIPLMDGKPETGYDALNGRVVNLIKEGIIDPAKVTRVVVENAASVAGLLLLTNTGISINIRR